MIEIKDDSSIRLESLKEFKHSTFNFGSTKIKNTPWETFIKTIT